MDREVLIGCKMLTRWDLLHETFPHETVRQYVKRKLKLQKVASVFNKSAIPSKVRVNTVPLECQMLRNKILTKYADIFKDKIGKTDRVNIPPVKLQLDKTKNIPPVHVTKAFDVAYHLRRPARKEFREMVDAGIVMANDEPSAWCSQAFPRMKPGSDPPRCRWVTDFSMLTIGKPLADLEKKILNLWSLLVRKNQEHKTRRKLTSSFIFQSQISF